MSRNLSFQKILLEISWIHFQVSVTLRSYRGRTFPAICKCIYYRGQCLRTCWQPGNMLRSQTWQQAHYRWAQLLSLCFTLCLGYTTLWSVWSVTACLCTWFPKRSAPALRLLGSSQTCLGSVEAEGSVCVVHTGDKDLFSNILYYSFHF